MPAEFLSDDEAAAFGRYAGPPSRAELDRMFYLDDEDLRLIATVSGACFITEGLHTMIHAWNRSSLWEERMKPNTISARVLAVGVASFGVLAGVLVAANPASAATPTRLCLNNVTFDRCIYASGANGAELADSSTPGMTNWTYPAVAGATAAIQQANVNLCLQLDYSKKDPAGMATVIGAPCVNDDAEKWVNVYDSTHNRTVFESYWAIKNLGGPQCLYGDPSGNTLAIYDCDLSVSDIAALEDWSTS